MSSKRKRITREDVRETKTGVLVGKGTATPVTEGNQQVSGGDRSLIE